MSLSATAMNPDDFNPRIPCGMRRYMHIYWQPIRYFNPRIPCGMRLYLSLRVAPTQFISIHASHAGCDAVCEYTDLEAELFQSTHPMRDATQRHFEEHNGTRISIHASHAGCDTRVQDFACKRTYFNPRIPCGMRPDIDCPGYKPGEISIHASHAGCDLQSGKRAHSRKISIHASHAGCDLVEFIFPFLSTLFQSTHPMRDATATYSECLIKVAKYSPFAQLI